MSNYKYYNFKKYNYIMPLVHLIIHYQLYEEFCNVHGCVALWCSLSLANKCGTRVLITACSRSLLFLVYLHSSP